MKIGKLILIGIITSNIFYAMDNPEIIVRNTSKDDSSKLVSKKKNPVIVMPTKSITLENSLSKKIAVEPYEHRVHIKDLFTVIPFNGKKKRLNEWILTKNKKFSNIEQSYFDHTNYHYNGTVKDFDFDALQSLSAGRGFYYSNSKHQINIIGMLIGGDCKNKKNLQSYFSFLLAHYMVRKGLINHQSYPEK